MLAISVPGCKKTLLTMNLTNFFFEMEVFMFARLMRFVVKKIFQHKWVDKTGFLAIIGGNLFCAARAGGAAKPRARRVLCRLGWFCFPTGAWETCTGNCWAACSATP
jgi:hypothetical protein